MWAEWAHHLHTVHGEIKIGSDQELLSPPMCCTTLHCQQQAAELWTPRFHKLFFLPYAHSQDWVVMLKQKEAACYVAEPELIYPALSNSTSIRRQPFSVISIHGKNIRLYMTYSHLLAFYKRHLLTQVNISTAEILPFIPLLPSPMLQICLRFNYWKISETDCRYQGMPCPRSTLCLLKDPAHAGHSWHTKPHTWLLSSALLVLLFGLRCWEGRIPYTPKQSETFGRRKSRRKYFHKSSLQKGCGKEVKPGNYAQKTLFKPGY